MERRGSTMGSPVREVLASEDPGVTVELRGVARRYQTGAGTVTALEAIDATLHAGDFVVILGPSGSGKTTLLNIIGALDIASVGDVVIAGRALSARSKRELFAFRRTTVSFIFQSFNLFPGLNALENVEFGADAAGRPDAKAIASTALTQVGLADRLTHFPHQLSGGEQQRVAIARALATGNQVLLADEPTGELDYHTGLQILALLRAEADRRKTVIVVTHNREIARMADRVIELSGGRIAYDGPPSAGRVPVSELRW
jgi:putative ABC transport system ATP-binding protein